MNLQNPPPRLSTEAKTRILVDQYRLLRKTAPTSVRPGASNRKLDWIPTGHKERIIEYGEMLKRSSEFFKDVDFKKLFKEQ